MLATDLIIAGDPRVPVKTVNRQLREELNLCATFPERVLFLDIETTGLSHYYDEITVVGWSFGGHASTLVKGQDHELLKQHAASAVALVTFNGIRFDARFLRNEYPDVVLPKLHVDLMYLCRRVGLTGGQKLIENVLGLEFRNDLKEVDGFAAVLLWHRYLLGDIAALDLLIRYNRCDIAAMGAIFDEAVLRLGIEPDLYTETSSFVRWSAPSGWTHAPDNLGLAPDHLKSAHTFDSLFGATAGKNLRVVGIDLTGSEARASGWALLDGHQAEICLLATDDEIIEKTLKSAPDLVSIDSPLCLPSGRIIVEDSDPGRNQFGIMRESERELKRRGINVYPCLLPSMQKLTARGIRLANHFRRLGVPVIESYPGAAQDIMRIPRKGAGKEWLQLGLKEFGILGDYDEKPVSHDELDAITSALVGTFHWVGMSEGLAGAEETALVIPQLDGTARPIIVGVSGPIAAGKTTLAQALESRGFAYTRFSQVIDDELRKRGEPLDRLHRQALGDEIHKSGRQRWLAERTLERVTGSPLVVVDGLRFPDDHAFLAERAGANYTHVFVDADENTRRQRYASRGVEGSFDEAAGSSVESQVDTLRERAHRVLGNNSNVTAIEQFAADLAAQITKEKECPSP